jgi:hypothetical protein
MTANRQNPGDAWRGHRRVRKATGGAGLLLQDRWDRLFSCKQRVPNPRPGGSTVGTIAAIGDECGQPAGRMLPNGRAIRYRGPRPNSARAEGDDGEEKSGTSAGLSEDA